MSLSIIRNIDLDTKLRAACAYDFKDVNSILKEYIKWDKNNYSLNRQDYLSIFDFNALELHNYLQKHPEICDQILQQSYDKRYSPSTFIEERDTKFYVAWFDTERKHIRVFGNLVDAATDYILFSWGIDRY